MAYTWEQFKTKVKGLMTDASVNDLYAALAVAEFIKAHIAQHVNKDPAGYAAHMAAWTMHRGRLLGYTVQAAPDAFRAQVALLLTVDANRHGIAEFIDMLIAQAKNDLAGAAAFLDGFIRQGVIDLQTYVEIYRQNHESVFAPNSIADDNEATIIQLPEECMIQDAYYFNQTTPSIRIPIVQYDWQSRYDLIYGATRTKGDHFYMAIAPTGRSAILFPALLDGYYLSIFWDGLKLEFADADAVPFDEGAVMAVGDYVRSRMYLQPQSLNAKMSAAHMAEYITKRRSLFRDARDKTRMRYNHDSPQPHKGGGCGSDCAVTSTTPYNPSSTVPLTDPQLLCLISLSLAGHGSPEGVVTGVILGQPYTDLDTMAKWSFGGTLGTKFGWG